MIRALFALALLACLPSAKAETFIYRGTLEDRGLPAEGLYDLQLRLYADAQGKQALRSPIELKQVPVIDGQFAISVDVPGVPPHLHSGWLEIEVKSPGDADYWPLPGRSEVVLKGAVCPASWALAGNAGTNAASHFVGTTDGAPLVLRSSAGVGINTTGVRGMLTVRGPDDFVAGPVIHLAGNSGSQFESGRIRFVNTTAAGNYRGFYLHYDGGANLFHIGGRDSLGEDPADDRNIISVRRSAPTRVGIGKEAPSSALDVGGDIALDGNLRFSGRASHFITMNVGHFNADNRINGNNCVPRFGGLAKRAFQSNNCAADTALTHLPNGARIIRFAARITQQGGANGCGAGLASASFEEQSPTSTFVGVEAPPRNAGLPLGQFTLTSQTNRLINNRDEFVEVRMFSRDDNCAVVNVRIEYTLPDGFVP